MGVLIKPVITEKMTSEGEKFGKYAFVVDKKANKIQIKEAVEAAYNVTVEAVNTSIHPGKSKSRFTKTGVQKGRTGSYKKAIISLKDGDVIDFYSNI